MASPKLIELGQQSVAAVATNVARGAPLVRCQLLASEFYEALKDELRETCPTDVAKRDTLLAASIQCLVPQGSPLVLTECWTNSRVPSPYCNLTDWLSSLAARSR